MPSLLLQASTSQENACEVVTSELTLSLLKLAKSRSSWKIFLGLDHVFLFPLKPWIDVKNAWRNYKGFLIFFPLLTTYIFQIFYNEYAICMIIKNIFLKNVIYLFHEKACIWASAQGLRRLEAIGWVSVSQQLGTLPYAPSPTVLALKINIYNWLNELLVANA